MALRVALFVEGGQDVPPPRRDAPLFRIWSEILPAHLGLRVLDPIFPISKKNLVAMDPSMPVMSGAGEGLDQLIARKLQGSAVFDAAIVAWDIVPAWNPTAESCRWQETLALYEGLARSDVLPDLWREQARSRLADLRARERPSARPSPPRLRPGVVLPLCMEPMFEGLLVQDEAAARRALGVQGRPVRDWPSGWGDRRSRRPDLQPLGEAIRAVKAVRPQLDVVKRVRGDLRTNKDEWGAWILERLLTDDSASELVRAHPTCARLRELAASGGESSG